MRYYRKFLKELEAMPNNLEMIKHCNLHLKKIGEGSSRIVFALTDKLVLKIARNKVGVKQNEIEAQVWNFLDYDKPGYKKYFAKVHVALQPFNDLFLVMDRGVTHGRKPHKDMANTIYFSCRGMPEHIKAKTARVEVLTAEALRYVDLTLDTRIMADARIDQLGTFAGGRIKMIDYGLNRYAWNTMYMTDRNAASRLSKVENK